VTITRWEYSKAKSNYHFDPRRDEDGAPPFRILGHVSEDLKGEFERLSKIEQPLANTFTNRLKVRGHSDAAPYTRDMDLEELRYRGLPEDHCFFHVVLIRQSELFRKVAASFAMERWGADVHIQYPGQSFPYHVDELPGFKKNDPQHWLDGQPDAAARFEIQILDWQPGHVWAYGNTYWKQWRSGEIAFHHWRHIPHGTANISRSIRATLQVTGFVTAQTRRIIESGYGCLQRGEAPVTVA
jgi:hypothetical protein